MVKESFLIVPYTCRIIGSCSDSEVQTLIQWWLAKTKDTLSSWDLVQHYLQFMKYPVAWSPQETSCILFASYYIFSANLFTIASVPIQPGCWKNVTTPQIFGEEHLRRQIFSYFKLRFHNEGLDCEKNYFEMFFQDWSVLSSYKISGFTVQPFRFFVEKCHICYHICGKDIFPGKYLRFYTSQKKNYQIWTKNEQKLGHYF